MESLLARNVIFCVLFIYLHTKQGQSHAPLYDGTDATLPRNLSNNTITDRIQHSNMGEVDNHNHALFEGDVSLNAEDEKIVDRSETGDAGNAEVEVQGIVEKRKAVRRRRYVWQSRIVPVQMTSAVAPMRNYILQAMAEIQQNSCVRFRDRQPEDRYFIRFVRKFGCWSPVGRQVGTTGGQELSLGPGCEDPGIILHELMHALGFWHEQARTDRDQFINVLWENVLPGQQKNFNRWNGRKLDFVGQAYDFTSVMHYGNTAFSKNGKPTMISIKDPNLQFGATRSTLSDTDKIQLNALYDCEVSGGGWSHWSNWGPCDEKCGRLRERFCTSKDRSKCPNANENGVELAEGKCQQDECYVPVPGHWGRWAAWGKCSRTCGRGYRLRSRVCDNPTPQYGGKLCQGSIAEVEECSVKTSCTSKKEKLVMGCRWEKEKAT
ncbi:zinc metalloproteinase nas-7 isoform X2 [Nematostella vectensis]|uniref:zinc metalloproteinase nas-7 isoform X2 n=1 Tax=Nematostella vectensis TaxID=45351 RepID=UPI0020774884|nr:zinc metalloproteinase nas-7 isoform X2 [Nematostella vectensis]